MAISNQAAGSINGRPIHGQKSRSRSDDDDDNSQGETVDQSVVLTDRKPLFKMILAYVAGMTTVLLVMGVVYGLLRTGVFTVEPNVLTGNHDCTQDKIDKLRSVPIPVPFPSIYNGVAHPVTTLEEFAQNAFVVMYHLPPQVSEVLRWQWSIKTLGSTRCLVALEGMGGDGSTLDGPAFVVDLTNLQITPRGDQTASIWANWIHTPALGFVKP